MFTVHASGRLGLEQGGIGPLQEAGGAERLIFKYFAQKKKPKMIARATPKKRGSTSGAQGEGRPHGLKGPPELKRS